MERHEGKKEGTIQVLPLKLKITGVQKDKQGLIQKYYVEKLGWIAKSRAIQLAIKGELDVVVVNRGGKKFLRSRPDKVSENNLSQMIRAK